MFLYRIGIGKDKDLSNFEKLKEIAANVSVNNLKAELLRQELENVKKYGTATAFLKLIELKNQQAVAIPSFCGGMPYSYLAYVLGISAVNPSKYNLYSCFSAHCPELFYVLADDKNILNVKAEQIEDLSSYDYSKRVILMWKMLNNSEEFSLENFEKVLGLKDKKSKHLFRNKIDNLSGVCVENLCCLIAEMTISRWVKDISRQVVSEIPDKFSNIFSSTDGKLLYKEQLFKICQTLLGYDYECFRKTALALECENPFTRPLLSGEDEFFLEEVTAKSQYLEWKGGILHQALLLKKILE